MFGRRPRRPAEPAVPTVLDRAAGSGLADGDGSYPAPALWTMGAAAGVLAASVVITVTAA